MPAPLENTVLDQLFLNARTFNRFTDRPVTDQTLGELYDTLKWGPTSMNTQPARYVFFALRRGQGAPAAGPGRQ